MEEVNEYDIAYIIATRNRPEGLRDFLCDERNKLLSLNVQVVIIDGSDNDHSKKIVKNFLKKDDKILYFHLQDVGLAERTLYGIEKCSGRYICIAGDTRCPRIECIKKVISLCKKGYTMIQTKSYPRYNLNGHEMILEYDNIGEFYSNHGHEAFTYSTTFYNKSEISSDKIEFIQNRLLDNVLFYVYLYFDISNFDGKQYCFLNEISQDDIFGSKRSFWLTSDKFIHTWCSDFDDVVKYLPTCYEHIKNDIIYNMFKYAMYLDKFRGLFWMRMYGCLSYGSYVKYKENYLKISGKSSVSVLMVSLLPIFCAKIIYAFCDKVFRRKLYSRCKKKIFNKSEGNKKGAESTIKNVGGGIKK